jgi:16S rRNA (guanine527-N7)-methyltransferase
MNEIVSRETRDRLESYIALIMKWNRKINLVSKNSTHESLLNHTLDCLDLLDKLRKKSKNIMDIGSGAGFPGMVLAIAGIENVCLVEPDVKKATFLEYVKNKLAINVEIRNVRVEAIEGFFAETIVSRAMTSSSKLIKLCDKIIDANTKLLLMKSKTQLNELEELSLAWSFELQIHQNNYFNNHLVFEIWQLKKK